MESEHHPKLSPVSAFQALYGNSTEEEMSTSLSDYHDYEPRLEFDDSELIYTSGLEISVGAGEAAGEHSLQQPHLSCAETAESIHTLLTPINSAEIVPTPCQILKIMLYGFRSYKGTLMRLLESTCSLESSLLVLHNAPLPPELLDLSADLLERASDGTIEENFEEELATAGEVYSEIAGPSSDDSFAELSGTGVVEVVGDDEIGRRIIIVSACRLPPRKDLHADKLLRYLMFTLDKYVEQDYSLVYFHYGLNSENRPSISWLWKAYKAFDRKYKKNLKKLYLVHPTNVIRIIWQIMRPAISVKFGQKMMYVNYLHELNQHLDLDQLCIPQPVLEYDKQLLSKNPRVAEMARQSYQKPKVPEQSPTKATVSLVLNPPQYQQFGVSLQFIKENHPNMIDSIPPVVRQCVEFLSQPDALETEGIFRRSANINVIKDLQRACNKGETISFRNDPHNAAVLLKIFLRDLEEPLMTFDLYSEILKFMSYRDKARGVKILILEKLPLDNYEVLKYIIQFLWKVQDRSCLNKMTSNNLAVVFGPNLAWPRDGQMSLQSIAPINAFTDFILANQESIFII